jgi:hypothetical protein
MSIDAKERENDALRRQSQEKADYHIGQRIGKRSEPALAWAADHGFMGTRKCRLRTDPAIAPRLDRPVTGFRPRLRSKPIRKPPGVLGSASTSLLHRKETAR